MTRWGATGTDWAVAAPHHLASEAGAQMLRRGGTAADAAIAAAAVLAVVYPNQCAVGGDVIALVGQPGAAPVTVNGSGAAPLALDVEQVRRDHRHMPWYGPHTVTVPGAVSAWGELHRRFGELPWAELLEPAVRAAADGVPVAPGLGRALEQASGRLLSDPGLAGVFAPGGTVLGTGQPLVQPALARSLEQIADHGPAALYEGALGGELVEGLRRLGCSLTSADLSQHRCEVTTALTAEWDGQQVHVAPPNSQGVVLLQILRALQVGEVVDPLGDDAGLLCALFALTAAERDQVLADPRVADVDVEQLLDPQHIEWMVASARASSTDRRTHGTYERNARYDAGGQLPPSGDTVAVVAADGGGQFVSLIESVYMSFGSGLLEPKTGILLHDRGACFTLDPASPNVLRPGARPAHTLLPVLLARDGTTIGALGTRGGSAQPQIHAQVLLHLAQTTHPEHAVSAPRWVLAPHDEEGTVDDLLVESDLAAAAMHSLASTPLQLYRLGSHHDEVGHAHAVRASDHGLQVGSDPRADGAALAG